MSEKQTKIELSWSLEDCLGDSQNEGLHLEACARLSSELATLRTKAALADEMAAWLVGWWPGLEDGISWPDNDDHPVIVAARTVAAITSTQGMEEKTP